MLIETLRQEISKGGYLDDVLDRVVTILSEEKSRSPDRRIGMVSGPINSYGPALRERNRARMIKFREKIEQQGGIPVISAADLFSESIKDVIQLKDGQQYSDFWFKLIDSPVITDIFTLRGWNKKMGAKTSISA